VWTLARITGHSFIAISYRYVHPPEDRVLDAMELLGGHKTGQTEKSQAKDEAKQLQETYDNSAA
jgi:hypothetical protein